MQPLVTAEGFASPVSVSERMGVFVGIQQMEYSILGTSHMGAPGPYAATGTSFSVAAGRVSFHYGLKGKLEYGWHCRRTIIEHR